MVKTYWYYGWLCLVISVSLGWYLGLQQIPTDTLVGDGTFVNDQYVLRDVVTADSAWIENGVNIYRTILRVDAQNVTDWLTSAPLSDHWQAGTQHQYLVERRDNGGKRAINITLEQPQLPELFPYTGLAILAALSFSVGGLLMTRHKATPPVVLPLLLRAGAAWLGITWLIMGIPFSYVVLQAPFLGQMGLHIVSQTLLLGALVHIPLVFPVRLTFPYQRLLLPGLYCLYPLGVMALLLGQPTPVGKIAAILTWEQQLTIAIKAVAYLIWAVQYRRAAVRQRGQLHWVLAAITAYDLVFLVRTFSASNDFLWLQLLLDGLLPFAFWLTTSSPHSWHWSLEGTSGFVHGVANTLTLALFLCGIGLVAVVFFSSDDKQKLPAVTSGLAIGFALTTVPLANLLREQFDSWFHGTRSAQRALLHEFTRRVSAQITLSEVAHALDEALDQGVQPAEKVLWLWNEETQMLQRWNEPDIFVALPADIHEQVLHLTGFTLVSQFAMWSPIQRFHGFMPLVVSQQLIGVLAIGRRADRREYSTDVLRFLETLARPATLALRNAQLVVMLEDKITALRQSYQQLIIAQETERSRLATELHDETLQQLAHLNLLAGSLHRDIAEPVARQLIDMQQVLATTERGLREILRGVHPAVLNDLGLIPALRSWLPQPAHVTIELSVTGFEQRLPDAMLELTLYRLCQESVNNALKHAHASRIVIRLLWQDNNVILEISDDGVGFEPAILTSKYRAEHGHFGIMNLRERVNAMNGHLHIHSQPQHGTLIRARLPLKART
jgi:signal transduction histidine kinase